MKIQIRSLSKGRRYSAEEKEFIVDRIYQEIEVSELEAVISNFVGDEPWMLIMSGGPKYTTMLELGPNGIRAIHTDIKD